MMIVYQLKSIQWVHCTILTHSIRTPGRQPLGILKGKLLALLYPIISYHCLVTFSFYLNDCK